MKAITVYAATDGTRWDRPEDAERRDRVDADVKAIEANLPRRPNHSGARVPLDPAQMRTAERLTQELVAKYCPDTPNASIESRVINESGGPLSRLGYWFMCANRERTFLYEQPYFANNEGQWVSDFIFKNPK